MTLFGASRPETAHDQELYLEGRLQEIACLDCLARVRVKKNSEQHTAVQWTSEALSQCQEFARLAAQPGGRPLYESCSRLMASIDRAVDEGQLDVGAIDGY
ncbi:MAG: hypothetical protein NVSMB48_21030 [Marmoricola sp.]